MKIYVLSSPSAYIAAFTVKAELEDYIKTVHGGSSLWSADNPNPNAMHVIQFEDGRADTALDITSEVIEDLYSTT